MAKYIVTLEFPAPDCCRYGDVAWEEVEAYTEEQAICKARLAVLYRIRAKKIELITPKSTNNRQDK